MQRVQQDESGPDDEKKNACSNSPTEQKDTLKHVSSVRAAKKRKNKVHLPNVYKICAQIYLVINDKNFRSLESGTHR